jgi:peptide/nickel transport system permease protein
MKRSDSDSSKIAGIDWERGGESAVELSRSDRLREFYEANVYQPLVVAMNDWRTLGGLTILGLYLFMAFVSVAGLWREPSTSQADRYLQPLEQLAYPLGTTQSGVDLLALIVHATPEILIMVTAGAFWATGLALLVGTVSGYKGGVVDRALMAVSDFAMAIPGLPLVIVLAFTFNPQNPVFVGIIITINYWAGLGRAIRSQVLSLRQKSYVEASRAMGTGTMRIIWKDLVPNVMPYVSINFVFAARYVVFASVGLYFLGVLPFSGQNWGVTLNFAYQGGAMLTWQAAHWLLVPMIAIGGLSLALVLLGQGLDRVFNPRVRTRLAGESTSEETGEDESPSANGQML